MQDSLFVCFDEIFSSPYHEFIANIVQHKRKIQQKNNIGKIRGYEKLNVYYGIQTALKENLITQPFCIIPLDSVLFSHISIEDKSIISFQVDSNFTPELVLENTSLYTKEELQENWPSVGKIVCFNQIPIEFFDQLIHLIEKLVFQQLKISNKFWDDTDRLALNLMLKQCAGKVHLQGLYDYQSDMHSNSMQNFICYEKGFVPIFEKKMFAYNPPYYLSLGNPFKVLSEHFPSGAFHYMSTLSQKYLNRKKRLKI